MSVKSNRSEKDAHMARNLPASPASWRRNPTDWPYHNNHQKGVRFRWDR